MNESVSAVNGEPGLTGDAKEVVEMLTRAKSGLIERGKRSQIPRSCARESHDGSWWGAELAIAACTTITMASVTAPLVEAEGDLQEEEKGI